MHIAANSGEFNNSYTITGTDYLISNTSKNQKTLYYRRGSYYENAVFCVFKYKKVLILEWILFMLSIFHMLLTFIKKISISRRGLIKMKVKLTSKSWCHSTMCHTKVFDILPMPQWATKIWFFVFKFNSSSVINNQQLFLSQQNSFPLTVLFW